MGGECRESAVQKQKGCANTDCVKTGFLQTPKLTRGTCRRRPGCTAQGFRNAFPAKNI